MTVVTDPVSRGEEEDRSDQWGPPVSVTRGKRKREQRGRWAAADCWAAGKNGGVAESRPSGWAN